MKRFDSIDRIGLLLGVAGVLGSLTGCAATPRPEALDDASVMLTRHQANELEALKPKLVSEAKSYLRKATEAHDRGDRQQAELYAHMAMNRFLTAENLVKSQSARKLAKQMVSRRENVADEAAALRSRRAELQRFRSLESRIAKIHAAIQDKQEGDAPDVVAAKRALSRARRKQAEAIGAGAQDAAPKKYQQGSSLVLSAVESLELGIYSEARQTAEQAVTAFGSAIEVAKAPKPEPKADPAAEAKTRAQDALNEASSAQALALAAGGPQSQPQSYQQGKILLASAERSFGRGDYDGTTQLAGKAKDAFDTASSGVPAMPAQGQKDADASGAFAASGGTLFDNRPIGQILLSLRFKRASMLGESKNETCPATFKEFEAILELAKERFDAGDIQTTREFVIRAQERLYKCEHPTATPEAATAPAAPKIDPQEALQKKNAASAIQKAQIALATARRMMPKDPRLAQPVALITNAEKWYDRGSFAQAEQLADKAVLALATIRATPPKDTKEPAPAEDPVKDEAANLIQKGQTLHAELLAKLGDDKRLAVPAQRLAAAERWFDRGRYAQSKQEARKAVTQLAKLREAVKKSKTKPKPGKAKTPEEIAAEDAVAKAKDARVKAVVALVPDAELKTPDKLLGLAEKALEQGRAKTAAVYAKKAEEVYLKLAEPKPRVELESDPDAEEKPETSPKNVCRQAYLKIAHAERLAAKTKGSHLTPGEKQRHSRGDSLATVALVRHDEGKCEEALMLGEEAVGALYPLPLRPASQKSKGEPKSKKPKAKKPKSKKPKAKKPGAEPVSLPDGKQPSGKSWKVAYNKTTRALKKRDRAMKVVIPAMKPTLRRGQKALAAGRRAYEAKRYADASRHADVAIAQFEAVIAASTVADEPSAAPSPMPSTARKPSPAGEPAPSGKPTKTKGRTKQPAWKKPYQTVYKTLAMRDEAKAAAQTEEAKKLLATGNAELAKAEAAWKAKDYPGAQSHATAAAVVYKVVLDEAAKEKKDAVSFKDADATMREARVIASLCERDKCAERDFKELQSANQMLQSAEAAMKKSDYAYADELAKGAKDKMLAILDKPRPSAPKPTEGDAEAEKKAKEAVAEAQIQEKLCEPRSCKNINLEGWLRAEKDLAAARSAIADGDPSRAVRLADQAANAFKAIQAPKATKPSFQIPDDAKGVSRAGSRLYVKPPVTFKTGSIQIDPVSKPSVEALAKTIKANSELLNRVRIIGFTDDRGSARLNKRISAKRAESVFKALVAAGVDRALLESEGGGEENPIADNSTAAGRAENRRVEIHIDLK